jgi:O-antigen ligase
MVKILSILALIGATLMLGTAPWMAGLAYSTVSIVQPQYIWFWAFQDLPVFKITAGLSIIAFVIKIARNELPSGVYREPIVIAVAALWVIFQLSDLFSPFEAYTTGARTEVIMNTLDIIVIMFLILVGLLDTKKAMIGLAAVYIFATLYYTWWANEAYLAGEWTRFSLGRLRGPLESPYRDGNVFSIVFVVGMPFLIFGVAHFRKLWLRLFLLAAIPLVWHAVVLCASRGALLAMASATAVAALMIRSKTLNMLMFAGFVLFLVYQGGMLTQRTAETLGSDEPVEQEADKPINPRILSWMVGWEMVKDYPILGVGPQRFKVASAQLYPGESPHVAHNTFLNFSANTGMFAGGIYLLFFYRSYRLYRSSAALISDQNSIARYINSSAACGLVGFFVGALFLDLVVFEPFYFLLLMIVANHALLLRDPGYGGVDA